MECTCSCNRPFQLDSGLKLRVTINPTVSDSSVSPLLIVSLRSLACKRRKKKKSEEDMAEEESCANARSSQEW